MSLKQSNKNRSKWKPIESMATKETVAIPLERKYNTSVSRYIVEHIPDSNYKRHIFICGIIGLIGVITLFV